MARLDRVKSWMSFFGWTADGGPGSVLLGAQGELIAVHAAPVPKQRVSDQINMKW